MAVRVLAFGALMDLWLVCAMQTGCSAFPLSAKPNREPNPTGTQAQKSQVKESSADSAKHNGLLATAGMEITNQEPIVPPPQDPISSSTTNVESIDCPVLEVASKVFPNTEKTLVSGGVILADLTKSPNNASNNSGDSQTGALGIPPLQQLSETVSQVPSSSDQKGSGSPLSKNAGLNGSADPEMNKKTVQETASDSGQTQPAGVESFQFTKLILCRRVDGFGQYEPVTPGYRFCSGAAGFPGERVLLYAEMTAPPGYCAEGTFRTNLAGEVEILRQNDQMVVCKLGFPGREDCCRTARKDHHLVYSFHVPPGLPPGTYTLRVNARDCSRNKLPSEKNSTECIQASAKVDIEVDLGRGHGEGTREKTNIPASGGNTK